MLADSAYPLSHYCLTPYDEQESQTSDSKCLFNVCHSQAPVKVTEDIYGMLKKRFPLIKHIRLHINNADRKTNMIIKKNSLQHVLLPSNQTLAFY